MGRDLLGSISELAEQLDQSRAALLQAMARARDIRDGTDASGTVTILLDDDGTARDIRVAADWRRRLPPAQVAAAVVAADGDAALRRATATTQALAEGSTDDVPLSTGDGPVPTGAAGWLVPVPTPEPGVRRSLAELSAAVWAAVDDLERVTVPPPPARGSAAQGAVQVTMAHGRITACEVHQGWLAHQDEITLAHALREAVCVAATAGLAARQPFIDYQQRLADVIAEATASLTQPRPGAVR